MSFATIETGFPGLKLIKMKYAADNRGFFFKAFNKQALASIFKMPIAEVFFSESLRGTIRGMHFQIPPADHDKIVFCLYGSYIDVVVDLRIGSPTYGKPFSVKLSPEDHTGLFIPTGFAHGFQVLSEKALACYLVSSSHSPAHDTGILWSSINYQWPLPATQVSSRDQAFMALQDFQSPFKYQP